MSRYLRVRVSDDVASKLDDLCAEGRTPTQVVNALVAMAHAVRFPDGKGAPEKAA